MTIFLGAEDNILLHGMPAVPATEQALEMENTNGNSVIHAFLLKRKSPSKNKPQQNNKDYQAKLRYDKAMTSIGRKRFDGAYFARLSIGDVVRIARHHPLPSVLILSLIFFMGVEYTLQMVPPSSQPFDVGFILTRDLHGLIASRPTLNSVLAAFNTVFVGMQIVYILWALLVEGRPRSAIAALFMFTCRGISGYSTQLPLPQGFLGSGVDFPVGNVSFFLFFSGHVGGSVIASLDMRRMERYEMAWTFDALNVLQSLRLLATRGHYTIDLTAGLGAGFLFDTLAGKYEEMKNGGRASELE